MLKELFDKYGSDKGTIGYGPVYDSYFKPLKEEFLVILELGIWKGASLFAWQEFFPNAVIIGVDNENVPGIQDERIHLYRGNQEDKEFLNSLVVKYNGFDIIIDDAGHEWLPQQQAFEYLWEHGLRANGLYIIEDLGTSFNPRFSGQYHTSTVTYLLSRASNLIADARRESDIEFIHFYPNQVVIKKRG